MKNIVLLLLLIIYAIAPAHSQHTETPTRGFLMTRVSSQDRTDNTKFPTTTPRGTQVYDLDTKSFWHWDGSQWIEQQIQSSEPDTTNDHWKNASGEVKLAYSSAGISRSEDASFVIKDHGSVGIGTNSPASKLHVSSHFLSTNIDLANFTAPFNTNPGNRTNIQIGTNASPKNSAALGFRYAGEGNNSNSISLGFSGPQDPQVVIQAGGNVGIGTINPLTSLEIRAKNATTAGTLVADDVAPTDGLLVPRVKALNTNGTQNGQMVYLIQDYTNTSMTPSTTYRAGFYHWNTNYWAPNYSGNDIIMGTLATSNPETANNTDDYTGSYIDLPPGKWIIFADFIVTREIADVAAGRSYWIRATFSDSNSNGSPSNDIIGAKQMAKSIVGLSRWELLAGKCIINNTSGITKRYHLWRKAGNAYGSGSNANTAISNFGSQAFPENQMFAVPAR